MVESFFTPEYVKSLLPYIQKTIDERLDAMISMGTPVDLVEEFALPVPSYASWHTDYC